MTDDNPNPEPKLNGEEPWHMKLSARGEALLRARRYGIPFTADTDWWGLVKLVREHEAHGEDRAT